MNSKRSDQEKALYILAYEFDPEEVEINNKKIRRNIGPKIFDSLPENWLSTLRTFRNDIYNEIKAMQPPFYVGGPGKYSDMSHFLVDDMLAHYKKKYPQVNSEIVSSFVPQAIYLYYLR